MIEFHTLFHRQSHVIFLFKNQMQMFLVVSLFGNIQLLMFEYFPEAIIRTSETIASTKRIEVQYTNSITTIIKVCYSLVCMLNLNFKRFRIIY